MKKRALVFTLALSALGPLTAPTALAQGQPPPPPSGPAKPNEADSHFRRGVELYKEADYTAALIEFRRAYEIDPRFQVLYNVGETDDQLQDYASALKTFEKYLRDGGAAISTGRRDEVQKEIEKLRTRVATLDVTTSVPDVELLVDDVSVGKTPLTAPLVVSAGRRKLTATRAGKPAVTQIVELAGGDTKKIALSLADDAATPPPPTPLPPPAGHVPVAGWVVTGILAAGAIVTGPLALVASSNLKTDRGTFPGNAGQLSSDHTKTVALAATTDVLIGCAIVVGAISIYFTATADSRARASRDAAGSSRGPRVSVHSPLTAPSPAAASAPFIRLQAGPQSAVLSGTF